VDHDIAGRQLMMSKSYTPLGFFQLTVTGAAQTLVQLGVTASILNGTTSAPPANRAIWRAAVANSMWRDDGTAPTSAIGILTATTDTYVFEYSGALSKLQFIQVGAGALLNVSLYYDAG
jgi:hypothetical protein